MASVTARATTSSTLDARRSTLTLTLPRVAHLLSATPPTSVAVGGHRGLGQNPLPQPARAGDIAAPPPHRENTVASLLAAAAAGASFVEVDAQVTADGVAVLWHDDAVVVAGPRGPVALPVSGLTLAQFQALNRNASGALAPPALSSSYSEGWATDGHRLLRPVAGVVAAVVARRRRRAAPGGTAPWAVAADDTLPTLAEALAALPPGLGINVEVKGASLAACDPAARAAGGRAARVETARVGAGVRAGLEEGGRRAGARPVLFSSFDVRLAGALRDGQGDWPVFLLSEEASPSTGLTAARLGLQGVVVDAAALLAGEALSQPPSICPAAVAALTRPPGGTRLRLATYGAFNDIPAVVAALVAEGVEAVIVDDVGGVVGGLKK